MSDPLLEEFVDELGTDHMQDAINERGDRTKNDRS